MPNIVFPMQDDMSPYLQFDAETEYTEDMKSGRRDTNEADFTLDVKHSVLNDGIRITFGRREPKYFQEEVIFGMTVTEARFLGKALIKLCDDPYFKEGFKIDET